MDIFNKILATIIVSAAFSALCSIPFAFDSYSPASHKGALVLLGSVVTMIVCFFILVLRVIWA
jgi:hypothetical protein